MTDTTLCIVTVLLIQLAVWNGKTWPAAVCWMLAMVFLREAVRSRPR